MQWLLLAFWKLLDVEIQWLLLNGCGATWVKRGNKFKTLKALNSFAKASTLTRVKEIYVMKLKKGFHKYLSSVQN